MHGQIFCWENTCRDIMACGDDARVVKISKRVRVNRGSCKLVAQMVSMGGVMLGCHFVEAALSSWSTACKLLRTVCNTSPLYCEISEPISATYRKSIFVTDTKTQLGSVGRGMKDHFLLLPFLKSYFAKGMLKILSSLRLKCTYSW